MIFLIASKNCTYNKNPYGSTVNKEFLSFWPILWLQVAFCRCFHSKVATQWSLKLVTCQESEKHFPLVRPSLHRRYHFPLLFFLSGNINHTVEMLAVNNTVTWFCCCHSLSQTVDDAVVQQHGGRDVEVYNITTLWMYFKPRCVEYFFIYMYLRTFIYDVYS